MTPRQAPSFALGFLVVQVYFEGPMPWAILLAFLVFTWAYVEAALAFDRAFQRDRLEGDLADLEALLERRMPWRRAIRQFNALMAQAGDSLNAWAATMAAAGNRIALVQALHVEEARNKARAVGMPEAWFEALLEDAREEARTTVRSFTTCFDQRFQRDYDAWLRGDDRLDALRYVLTDVAALREEYTGEKEPIRRYGVVVPPKTRTTPKGLR